MCIRDSIIESKDISTFTIKSLSQQYYNERSEFNSDFSPVAMDIQLNEYNTEEYNVTNDEVLQGNAMIESFHNSIINLNIDKPILMGIGMVGLKTKDLRGIGAIANGPRIPNFCIQLEDALHKSNIHLHKPIQYIGSDADNCGIGEEYGKDGLGGLKMSHYCHKIVILRISLTKNKPTLLHPVPHSGQRS
mgnify:CR=1 FL=1